MPLQGSEANERFHDGGVRRHRGHALKKRARATIAVRTLVRVLRLLL